MITDKPRKLSLSPVSVNPKTQIRYNRCPFIGLSSSDYNLLLYLHFFCIRNRGLHQESGYGDGDNKKVALPLPPNKNLDHGNSFPAYTPSPGFICRTFSKESVVKCQ